MMAGSVLTTLPVLLVFLALQRYYIEGLTARQRQGMTARARRARAGRGGWRRVARGRPCIRSRARLLPQVASAADSTGAVVLDDFAALQGVEGRRVRRRERVDRAPRSGRSPATGAAPRLRPRRDRRLRHRAARAADRASRELRDHVLRARRRAGQRFPGQADRRERRQRLVVRSSATSRFRATGSRSGSRSGRSSSRGDRPKDRALQQSSTIEFVVAAGRGGGKGLALSQPPGAAAAAAAAHRRCRCRWRARARRSRAPRRRSRSTATPPPRGGAIPSADPSSTSSSISASPREFGGLVLRWRDGRSASRYDVEFSDDGVRWRTVPTRRRRRAAGPMRSRCRNPRRAICASRCTTDRRAATRSRSSRSKDLAFGASPNAFFQALARDAPRGHYPRGFSGEQPNWTIVGVDGGTRDGAAVRGRRARGRARRLLDRAVRRRRWPSVVTWADVDRRRHSSSTTTCRCPASPGGDPRWELRVTTFAAGDRDASRLVARYDVRNPTRSVR